MKVFPYDPARVDENKAGLEPITEKQIRYILKLSKQRYDKDEFLNNVIDSIPGNLGVENLSKGQAMYVIKCLLGEIKQVEITPDIIQRCIADNLILHTVD